LASLVLQYFYLLYNADVAFLIGNDQACRADGLLDWYYWNDALQEQVGEALSEMKGRTESP